MKYEVLLRPEAEADIGESYQWYQGQIEGLARNFCALWMLAYRQYSAIHRHMRRFRMMCAEHWSASSRLQFSTLLKQIG